MFIQPAITIEGRAQFSIAAAGQTAPLDAGVYDVWCDDGAPAHIKVSAVANDVTIATGYRVTPGVVIPVRVGRAGLRIGSTAILHIHRVE